MVCVNRLEQCLKDLAKSELTDSGDIFDCLKAIKSETFLSLNICDELDLDKVLNLIKKWVRLHC